MNKLNLEVLFLLAGKVTGKTEVGNGKTKNESVEQNGEPVHALTLLAQIKLEGAPSDLAKRHDFYAHAKSED